jgi:hypothetical protein
VLTDIALGREMEIIPQVQAATEILWAKSFPNQDAAFASVEFHALVATCAEVFSQHLASQEGKSPGHSDHRWAVANLLRNMGANWDTDVPPSAAQIAATIQEAYLAKEQRITHLIPLNGADDLPKCTFGPWQLRTFNTHELAHLLRVSRLSRFGSSFVPDVRVLSWFQWLVLEETANLPSLQTRHFPWAAQTFDELLQVRPHRTELSPSIEHGLFAVSLFPWELGATHRDQPWQPFHIPWVYSLTDDPFQGPPTSPDITLLDWDVVDEGGRERVIVQQAQFDDSIYDDLEAQLRDLWHLVSDLLAPGKPFHPAINPLVRHFFLRAFRSSGIDQLLWHMIALDAALGGERRQLTKMLQQRISRLLTAQDGAEFRRLYALRSDFVHGSAVGISPLFQSDLAAARALVRRTLEAMLRLVHQHRGWTREALLQNLA